MLSRPLCNKAFSLNGPSKPASPPFIPTCQHPLFCAVRQPDGRGVCACARAPRTPAPHSPRAAGDPRDILLARETNQPQDPACQRANSKARTICSHTCQLGPQTWRTPADSFLPANGTLPQRLWQAARGPGRRRSPAWSSRHGGGNLSGGDSHEVDSPQHDARAGNPAQNLRSVRRASHNPLLFAKM